MKSSNRENPETATASSTRSRRVDFAERLPKQRKQQDASVKILEVLENSSIPETSEGIRLGKWGDYSNFLRHPEDTAPMRLLTRVAKTILRALRCCDVWKDPVDETSVLERQDNQYRIPPADEKSATFTPLGWFWSLSFESMIVWFYKTTFAKMIGAFFVLYFITIFFFVLLIHLFVVIGQNIKGDVCVLGFDEENRRFFHNFAITFELSWTTFSTVGYGTTSCPPELSCNAMRYLLTTEAFIGVLFAGFCGAILYNKVQLLHQEAQVTFSSAICLVYGNGITHSTLSYDHHESDEKGTATAREQERLEKRLPYLEFRCVNDSGADEGCEVIGATVKCMMLTVEAGTEILDHHKNDGDNDDDTKSASSMRTSRHKNSRNKHILSSLVGNTVKVPSARSVKSEATSSTDATQTSGPIFTEADPFHMNFMPPSKRKRQNVKKRAYRNVSVSPNSHPYFALGGWNFRHYLDHTSPLLRRDIRQRIRELGGWPQDLNTAAAVRSCISDEVQEIFITFSGMSNLTAESVFTEVSYDTNDIFVGWRFASMAYFVDENEGRNTLGVEIDRNLIHDILPQQSGGEEPINSPSHAK